MPSDHSAPPNSRSIGATARVALPSQAYRFHQPLVSSMKYSVPSAPHCGSSTAVSPPATRCGSSREPSAATAATCSVVRSHGMSGWFQAMKASFAPSAESRG